MAWEISTTTARGDTTPRSISSKLDGRAGNDLCRALAKNDTNHTGRVSAHALYETSHALGIPFTNGDLRYLDSQYTKELRFVGPEFETDELFNYRSFFESADVGDGKRLLPQTPSATTRDKTLSSSVKSKCCGQQQQLLEVFQKSDRRKSGGISYYNFRRSTCALGIPLKEEEFVAIFALFDTGGHGRVNYVEFIAQLAESVEAHRSRVPASTTPAEVMGREELLRRVLPDAQAAVNMWDACLALDTHLRRAMSMSTVKQVLYSSTNLSVADQEILRAIAYHWGLPDGIDYGGLARDAVVCCTGSGVLSLVQRPVTPLESILEVLYERLDDLRDELLDIDRAGRSFVTMEEFERAAHKAHAEFTEEQCTFVQQTFPSPGGHIAHEAFYLALVEAWDGEEEQEMATKRFMDMVSVRPVPQHGVDYDAIGDMAPGYSVPFVEIMVAKLHAKRLLLLEAAVWCDDNRTGRISVDMLWKVLHQLGIMLDREECTFVRRFCDLDHPDELSYDALLHFIVHAALLL